MEFILELFTGIIAAWIAGTKNRNRWFWFFVGFFTSIFGIIVVAILPAARRNNRMRPTIYSQSSRQQNSHLGSDEIKVQCPHCHSNVVISEPGQWICPHCQNNFTYDHLGRVAKDREALAPSVELLIKLLAKMAKADGTVTRNEIALVDKIVKSELNPNETQLRQIREIFNQAKTSAQTPEQILEELYPFFRADVNALKEIVTLLYEISNVDAPIHPEQERIIEYAAHRFHLGQDFRNIKSQYVDDMDAYFKVLGCSPSDSVETIKKSYRKLIKEYHPDRYANQDLPKEFIDLANKKVKDITEAYEKIMKYKTSA